MITLYSLLLVSESREVAHLPKEQYQIFSKEILDLTFGDFIVLNQTPVFNWPSTDMLFTDIYTRYAERLRAKNESLKS